VEGSLDAGVCCGICTEGEIDGDRDLSSEITSKSPGEGSPDAAVGSSDPNEDIDLTDDVDRSL
jgi:hypothetical protein